MTPTTKVNCFWQIRIIFIFICSCLFVGCSAPEKRFQKEQLTITYRSQLSFSPEIKELHLEHPIKISAEQTTNHLLSLHYEELTLLGRKKYVFSPNDILKIVPLITKALNRMRDNKILHYEVETPKGATIGTIFRAKNKINWRFETINGSNFLNTGMHNGGSTWALFPKNGQHFHKESTVLGNENKKNWIISNLDLQVQSKRGLKSGLLKKIQKKSSGSKGPNQKLSTIIPTSEKGEFEKRLQFLKKLRQKQLIDDEEYKYKKTELLNQFP